MDSIDSDEDFSGGLTTDQQRSLGKPATVAQLNPKKVKEYLDMLIDLLDEKIDFIRTSSLLHKNIYEKLKEEEQGRVDNVCVILMGYLRMLKGLIERGETASAQAEHYVQLIWQYKEKLETDLGDVLIL